MRKIMSREWSSSMGTISDREGLFAPAFCALIVRSVRLVAVGRATLSDCACLAMSFVPYEVIGSVDVGLAGMRPPWGHCRVGWAPEAVWLSILLGMALERLPGVVRQHFA